MPSTDSDTVLSRLTRDSRQPETGHCVRIASGVLDDNRSIRRLARHWRWLAQRSATAAH